MQGVGLLLERSARLGIVVVKEVIKGGAADLEGTVNTEGTTLICLLLIALVCLASHPTPVCLVIVVGRNTAADCRRLQIRKGDRVLAIDETSVSGLDLTKICSLIKGNEGTYLTVHIARTSTSGEVYKTGVNIMRS